MSRPIILSNGELHVGLNSSGYVHDFYYPYVGGENHAEAHHLQHQIGIWVDGRFSWLNDGTWEISHSYLPETLIGVVSAKNTELGLILEFINAVDSEQAAFIRSAHIVNLTERARDVRLFMHQIFNISNSYASDTAQYLPSEDAIVHYKGNRSFVVSGIGPDRKPFDQHAVGINGIEGHDGVYRDAEDGELSGSNVEHGRVDSVIRFSIPLSAHDSKRVHYWIAAGKSQREALLIHKKLVSEGALHRLLITDEYWRRWIQPAKTTAAKLPPRYQDGFLQSIILIKAAIDKRGAVIASTDTEMLNYSRDTYAYSWPRDGAFALWPLIRLGYTDEALHFFTFCRRVLSGHGHLMHKYQPDGSLGSSWHPYQQQDGYVALPIQEDETAIVVFLFAHFYALHPDSKLLNDFYPTMILPMANFLASHVDSDGLPLPSYDLWERLFLVSTYTVSVVYAALSEAAHLAELAGDKESSVRWQDAAETMQSAARKELFDDSERSLIKGYYDEDSGTRMRDATIDISSSYGAYMFGLFDAHSAEVSDSFALADRALKTSDTHPGLARFEDDEYDRYDPNRVGNPWIITTLWRAQYALEVDDKDTAIRLLDWVTDRMGPTFTLPEQLDPDTQQSISVSPLTWSQAEYVSCLLDYLNNTDEGPR